MGRVIGRLIRTKEEVAAPNGVVTAKQPPAALAGLDVLERGGNAVDAAVVTQLCTGVLIPNASGIGGGGYLVFHDAAAGQTHVVDYANESPAAALPERFPPHPDGGFGSTQGWRRVRDDANFRGWRSMCVPGVVAGLALALDRWGTLTWAQALEPAIVMAEEGSALPAETAVAIVADWELLKSFPSSFATFTDRGRPLRAGERVRYPALARTLRRLAEVGPEDFYRGQIARDVAADMEEHGGHITLDDWSSYHARGPQAPLELEYRGVRLQAPRASCGAVTAFETLAILAGFDLSDLDPHGAQALHLLDVANRLAFADRHLYVGDAAHVDVPWQGLISQPYAAQRRALIDPTRTPPRYDAGDPWPFEGRPQPDVRYQRSHPWEVSGTQHLNVVDRHRNVVALTDTNVGWSGVILPRAGFMMNNAMTWHDPQPGRAASMRPHSRGLNNMAPTVMLRDGRPWGAVGARGGRHITGTVARALSLVIDHSVSIQDAVSAPMIDSSHPQTRIESRIDPQTRAELEALGHTLAVVEGRAGASAGGVVIDHAAGLIHAGEDPTGESLAAGY
ncbi:MAG TPA: gamma-glutamyltransferase family protein [Chloroflexota bacterium]|nr:gamma-glutamyltransferase family protein [Chloroflexota bacterium]